MRLTMAGGAAGGAAIGSVSITSVRPEAELARLRNLGAVSAGWLVAAGIRTEAELRELGALEAFRRVAFQRSGDVSANLLYALEGAIRDVRWDRLPMADRLRLRAEAGIG